MHLGLARVVLTVYVFLVCLIPGVRVFFPSSADVINSLSLTFAFLWNSSFSFFLFFRGIFFYSFCPFLGFIYPLMWTLAVLTPACSGSGGRVCAFLSLSCFSFSSSRLPRCCKLAAAHTALLSSSLPPLQSLHAYSLPRARDAGLTSHNRVTWAGLPR